MLERWFKRVLIERQAYTRIGGWWDRKAENINMAMLEAKAAAFLRATGEFRGYVLSCKGLSMGDM